MAKRPARLRGFIQAFKAGELDLDALRHFQAPVYLALGGQSNPDHYAKIAERLARVFPNCTLEVFAERHHFAPPHRAEPSARSIASRPMEPCGHRSVAGVAPASCEDQQAGAVPSSGHASDGSRVRCAASRGWRL
jgi:hypothetical protein